MASLAKSFPETAKRAAATPLTLIPKKKPMRISSTTEPIAAARAKTHLLQLLDQVERDRKPITISKRGRIVAHLIPAEVQKQPSAFESMLGRTKGWMTITGDIVSPDHESWGAEWK